MGNGDSKCSSLLERMGWAGPVLADDLCNSNLAEYLQNQDFEVVLPRHAPQCDISMADKKPQMFPRPNFCWEAYKMHVALIGPSSACKKQIVDFLPKISHTFQGPACRINLGRNAVPHYFLDERLHRLVVWELPEINWKQSCDDYIRELGLLYVDCVFALFSDKYVVTDIYSKLCVAMALHGIPFFVVCTMSGDELDEKAWHKLKSDFSKKDIQPRMFNPNKPDAFIGEILAEFLREVQWNRSQRDGDITKDVGEHILGQTVRLKNIEKKPELNGKCGVCIGYHKEQDRYRVRIILGGVETDLALRQNCISILKPKLLNSMVKVNGLESRPELNGRYAMVDEFLRENERYRVFIPGKPGTAQVLALKSTNLEAVTTWRDAVPVTVDETQNPVSTKRPKAKPKPTHQPSPDAKQGMSSPSVAKTCAKLDPTSVSSPANVAKTGGAPKNPMMQRNPVVEIGKAKIPTGVAHANDTPPDRPAKEKPVSFAAGASDDLMSRIFTAENVAADENKPDHSPSTSQRESFQEEIAKESFGNRIAELGREKTVTKQASRVAGHSGEQGPRRRLSKAGVLSMRVWAVVGNSDNVEEILDHLMDCGKTVFGVGEDAGGHFATVADVTRGAHVDVIAFVDEDPILVRESADAIINLGLKGIILHPSVDNFDAETLQSYQNAGIPVHGADIFADVFAGEVFSIAPIH